MIASGKRIALVIGNSAYTKVGNLPNAAGDATAFAAALRRVGFTDVIERSNLTQSQMSQAIKDFGEAAAGADWAVVYYAGHGIEVGGVNYLIPTDARLRRDTDVGFEAISLNLLRQQLSGVKKLRMVILDACRENPFTKDMVVASANREIMRGLKRPGALEKGEVIVYAAAEGQLAADGSGHANGPFMEAMLATIEEPGLELNFLFRKVRDRVLEKTKDAQHPFVYESQPSEYFYFKSPQVAAQ